MAPIRRSAGRLLPLLATPPLGFVALGPLVLFTAFVVEASLYLNLTPLHLRADGHSVLTAFVLPNVVAEFASAGVQFSDPFHHYFFAS
jgi:hypothetical protein